MIKLKINGEKKEIPTSSELTVNQYVEFISSEKQNIVSYLSVVLGINYKEAFFSKVGNNALLKRIGKVEDYSKIKPSKKLVFKDSSFFYVPDEISTVGQRWMIEENAQKMEQEEYFCFVLAVGLASDSMDFGKVNDLKEKIMNEPYLSVLPTAFFLLKNSLLGKSSGVNYFSRLIALTAIRISKNNLVSINFPHI